MGTGNYFPQGKSGWLGYEAGHSHAYSSEVTYKCSIHGVFNKRPNFLNSAPTGTGNALWLLSAPSGRF
jgi:hypothetical protein